MLSKRIVECLNNDTGGKHRKRSESRKRKASDEPERAPRRERDDSTTINHTHKPNTTENNDERPSEPDRTGGRSTANLHSLVTNLGKQDMNPGQQNTNLLNMARTELNENIALLMNMERDLSFKAKRENDAELDNLTNSFGVLVKKIGRWAASLINNQQVQSSHQPFIKHSEDPVADRSQVSSYVAAAHRGKEKNIQAAKVAAPSNDGIRNLPTNIGSRFPMPVTRSKDDHKQIIESMEISSKAVVIHDFDFGGRFMSFAVLTEKMNSVFKQAAKKMLGAKEGVDKEDQTFRFNQCVSSLIRIEFTQKQTTARTITTERGEQTIHSMAIVLHFSNKDARYEFELFMRNECKLRISPYFHQNIWVKRKAILKILQNDNPRDQFRLRPINKQLILIQKRRESGAWMIDGYFDPVNNKMYKNMEEFKQTTLEIDSEDQLYYHNGE